MRMNEFTPSEQTSVIDEDSYYPHTDGKPLGESSQHFWSIVGIAEAIRDLLMSRENEVSVHADMFWYWEQGNRQAVRAPDLMVLFGVPYQANRLSYRAWNHGNIAPAVIIETASQEQQPLLMGELREQYERLGVREYFIFDHSGGYMPEPLIGYRLRGDRYQRIRPDANGSLASRQLGVRLRPEGDVLRLVDSETGEPIPTRAEKEARSKADMVKAQADSAKAQADSARAQADMVKAQAKAETIARNLAAANEALAAKEAELARLRELLKQAGITPPEIP